MRERNDEEASNSRPYRELAQFAAPAQVRKWPIATDDALTARCRFRGIADMDRFSSRNDL